MDKFGHFGYSAYFMTLELIHKHGVGGVLKMRASRYCSYLRSRMDLVKVWLTFSESLGKVSWKQSGNDLLIKNKKFIERQRNLKSKAVSMQYQRKSKASVDIEGDVDRDKEKKQPSADKPRTSGPFQIFMDRILKDFYDINMKDKAAVSSGYKRFGRAAKDIMAFAGGDPEKAYQGVDAVADYMQSKGLSWTLDTAAKWFPDWMNGGLGDAEKEKEQVED